MRKIFGKVTGHEIRVAKSYQMMAVMAAVSEYVGHIELDRDVYGSYLISFELDPEGFDCFLADKGLSLREKDAIVIK